MVILCIALNWLGDSLDGTLARVRRQQRPRYGFYVDHMVDIFGSVALLGGLGWSGLVHWQVAVGMLVGFLLLSGESYLATYTLGQFELSQGLFGPTELRILLVMGNLALLRSPYATVFGHRLLLFDIRRGDCGGGDVCDRGGGRGAAHGGAVSAGAFAVSGFVRWLKFNAVGAVGMGVQLAALAIFNRWMAGHYLLATAAAIEVTLLHNFAWHVAVHVAGSAGQGAVVGQMVRFHLSNGAVSMVGNLALMRLLVEGGRDAGAGGEWGGDSGVLGGEFLFGGWVGVSRRRPA